MLSQQLVATKIGQIYTEFRKGKNCIVFLSGVGDFSTSDNFQQVLKKMPEDWGYLTVDYPCSGKSPVQDQSEFGVGDYIEAVRSLLQQFQIEDFIMCAHSISGVIVLNLANKAGNPYKGAVLLELTTSAILFGGLAENLYPEFVALEQEISEKYGSTFNYLKEMSQSYFNEHDYQLLWQHASDSACRNEVARLSGIQELPQISPRDFESQISEKQPVVIFAQAFRQDEYNRSEYKNHHPLSQVMLGGSTHYLQWSESEKIVEALGDLLDRAL